MIENGLLEIRLLSSLEKVFPDGDISDEQWHKGSMLLNETYSFQVAYNWNGHLTKNVKVSVNSELSPWITIRKIGLVASELPCIKSDENVLRTTPGLYPDPLIPLDDNGLTLLTGQWRSLWVTINLDGQDLCGTHPIEIVFKTAFGDELGKTTFQIERIGVKLAKQSLIHTEWIHTDCLSTWYGVAVFSEEYWYRTEQYIKIAVMHGINMILTPVFTPPLDTEIGGERPTVQLVQVNKEGNTYKFGFENLKRWIDLCRSNGVEYFEFSHFFTQWGAKHAPKIIVTEEGNQKKLFGWTTDAQGEEYKCFLSQFLPEMVEFIKRNNLEAHSFFHISDEPRSEDFGSYKSASAVIMEYLHEFPVIDALSDYKFYEMGIVKNPVVAIDHIQPFIEHKVPNLWAYYCGSQYQKVSNRFFNMPSARSRILGIQLYKYNIYGFLHWGFNFWYSQFSRFSINPFQVTDAGCAFPSGDAFLVYPHEEGPIESIRLEVFYEALQDLRALRLLEEKLGREFVLELLEQDLKAPLTFEHYPADSKWLLSKREQINHIISKLV